MYMYTCIHIYIYIGRERERESHRSEGHAPGHAGLKSDRY